MNLKIKTYVGKEILQIIPELAKLRIKVFYEWPYIYDGDIEYEEKYLKVYTDSPKSFVAVAYDGQKAIGATTAIPLQDESVDFQRPLENVGVDISKVFYFGESILLGEYRGLGIGVEFFKLREEHARRSLETLGLICFATVEREDEHPLCPQDYKSLESFWLNRGYLPKEDIKLSLSWKDRDQEYETKKLLKFWFKELVR